MHDKIRVVIADDHPVVRDGLRLTLEKEADDVEVVGEASNGPEALGLADSLLAHVYIIDITMPELNGIETTRRLLKQHPEAKVIILSLHGNEAFVRQAIESGASGYLLKESATRDVLNAIRDVHAGRCYLSPGVAHVVVSGYLGHSDGATPPSDRGTLTGREREIVQLIAEGASSKEIAAKLGLSVNTVHVHRSNLMSKLDLHKQTDIVRYAIREGLAKL